MRHVPRLQPLPEQSPGDGTNRPCDRQITFAFFQLEIHGGIFHSCCSLTVIWNRWGERHRYYSLTPSQTDPPSPTHEQQSLCSSAHCSCLVGSRHRRAPVKDREDCRYYKCPTVVFHTSKCLKTHPCGCQSDPVHSTESRGRVTCGSSEHSQTFT